MYCIKCGSDNSETAVYCRKCGVPIEAEEETRVATRKADAAGEVRFAGKETGELVERLDEPSGIERINRENHPDSPTTSSPEAGATPPQAGGELSRPPVLRKEGSDSDEPVIFSIRPTLMFVKIGYVLAAIGTLLIVAVFSAVISPSPWWAVLVGLLFGLLLFLVPGFYHIKQKLIKYTLTDSTLEVDTGLIARTTRNVPITRIQDVTVSATPWQRLMGIGDLIIDNASEQGGNLVMKNINTPKKHADMLLKQMRLLDQ